MFLNFVFYTSDVFNLGYYKVQFITIFNLNKRFSRHIVNPVSYTHLDVYKRQDQSCDGCEIF